jgi:hypothetical protein
VERRFSPRRREEREGRAYEIVRWYASALSQLVPITTFLVVGSLSLLLAVSSYPVDQQGWFMTLMVLFDNR